MAMRLPFDGAGFEVLRLDDATVWPAQIAFLAATVAVALLAYHAAMTGSWASARGAFALLAALWSWSGIVDHRMIVTGLTPGGRTFGSLLIAEGALLFLCIWQNGRWLVPASRTCIAAGTLLIFYAIVSHPAALAVASGHRFPAQASLGVLSPLTAFTFGIFCLMPGSVPRFAMAIPLFWSIVGPIAAFDAATGEGLGLPVAAIAASIVIHRATHRPHQTVAA